MRSECGPEPETETNPCRALSDRGRVSMVLVRGLGVVVTRPVVCLCVVERSQVVYRFVDEIGVRRGLLERRGAALVALALAPGAIRVPTVLRWLSVPG